LVGGESENPDLVYKIISDYLENKKEITKEEFDRIKKAIWGNYIKIFNDVEAISSALIRNVLKGVNWFEFAKIFDLVTLEFVNEKYNKLFKDETLRAISKVFPQQEN